MSCSNHLESLYIQFSQLLYHHGLFTCILPTIILQTSQCEILVWSQNYLNGWNSTLRTVISWMKFDGHGSEIADHFRCIVQYRWVDGEDKTKSEFGWSHPNSVLPKTFSDAVSSIRFTQLRKICFRNLTSWIVRCLSW